jgi:hypothetical protein
MLTFDDMQQVHHVARLAVLAMCARGVAASEFESSSEISEMVVRVSRDRGVSIELPVDVEFLAPGGLPIGGLSL